MCSQDDLCKQEIKTILTCNKILTHANKTTLVNKLGEQDINLREWDIKILTCASKILV